MNNTELELQKITLENEIAQLTKNRDSLLDSIDRHEIQYNKQRTELNNEIKVLTEQKNALSDEVENLKHTETELSNRTTQATTEAIKFEETEIERISDRTQQLEDEAAQKLAQAEAIFSKNIAKETELSDKENYILEVSKTIGQKNLDLQAREESLILKDQELNTKITRVEQEVTHLESKQQNLLSSIDELTKIQLNLNERLEKGQNRLRDVTVEVISQLSDQKQRNLALTAKEEALDKKERDLSTKELQLEDREATIGRAYQELINKGGQLNG